jgi:RNA polymerase-associated protein
MGVVAKRSSMTFFSDGSSHYSHRVRIVLAEKGVTVDVIEADANNKPEELADLNPYNSLPTLLDRDLVLYESKVMMEYLDERFPHPPLLPVYPVARGISRQLIYRIERDWCQLVDSILAGELNAKTLEKNRKELREGLLSVAPIFAEKPFFMNEEFTLVDCCMAPILWRLPALGIELPNNKQTKPLLDYMEALFKRKSFRKSLSEQERDIRNTQTA